MAGLDLGIFTLGRIMEEKFPALLGEVDDEALSQVDLAIPEVPLNAKRLSEELLPKMSCLRPGDYEGLLQLLSELRELFEHTREHLEAADEGLWKLSEVVVKRTGGKG